jgi:putative ABC transport system permease protein
MTGVAVALVLVLVAIAISRVAGLQLEKEIVVAALRTLVQLSLLAVIIAAVFESLAYSGLFLAGMLMAASWTSGRRLERVPNARWVAAASIGTAAAAGLAVLFGGRAFPLAPQWVIPIGGMLIGNAMTTASLAGSRLRDEIFDKTLEIEARLALGVRASEALSPYVRRSLRTGLIPIIDATKNAGLILIPGAFVGMILGGSSPADAAKVQLIVLFMLLGAVAIAGMLVSTLVARAFLGPGERLVLPSDRA